MASNQITWGILGCGDVCEKKAGPALYGVGRSRLVAVMRRDAGKAADFAKRHNVPRHYSSVAQLMSDAEINAIYVSTPDAAHHEGTLAAAHAGKHVLVEKAMATNTLQCDEMIEACRKAGVVLAVAYYRRGYASIRRAKEWIDRGEIGTLQTIWINDEFPLSHRLDLCHYYCGDAALVSSREEKLPEGSHAQNGEVLYLDMKSGTTCMTNKGWKECLAPERLDFKGSKGSISIHDLKGGRISITREGVTVQEQTATFTATHWGLVENFVAHLLDAEPLLCDGMEGRKSTVILDLVESVKPGAKPVVVSY